MKYLIAVTLLVTTLLMSACGGEKPNRPSPALSADRITAQNATFDAPEIPSGQVNSGVRHYICPNGHEAQGTCIICGSTLEHNQAFHDVQPNAADATAEPSSEPPQNADGVWHYVCPNGHDGGSGSASPCPICGTVMEHNTVYHSGAGAATADPITTTTSPAATPTAEPPQNAAGIWHYICPNGHDGGGGSATACSVCGTTLEHNTAYHN